MKTKKRNQVVLSRADWVEIYYALESKKTSAAVDGDKKWIGHLDKIMKKIGPDGDRAVSRGTSRGVESWWTVCLVPPPNIAQAIGVTWFTSQEKGSIDMAVEKAKRTFKFSIHSPDLKVEDIEVSHIFRGRQANYFNEWKKKMDKIYEEGN